MQRYFIDETHWHEQTIDIIGGDFHHIVHVMRMDVHDKIIANHHDGRSAICEIIDIGDHNLTANVLEWLEESKELPVSVTIAQGLPKGDKWEFILQKGTELGAHHFIPFQAYRSIVKWDDKKLHKKIPRWNKIVKEASEQSHRTIIPTVESVLSVRELCKESSNYDWKFFAYEEETRSQTKASLHERFSQIVEGQSVVIAIGPEGGFAEEEVELLKNQGFQSIRLGPRILRTETAPLYVLSNLSYYFEEMR